jgi:hypothetical protein
MEQFSNLICRVRNTLEEKTIVNMALRVGYLQPFVPKENNL